MFHAGLATEVENCRLMVSLDLAAIFARVNSRYQSECVHSSDHESMKYNFAQKSCLQFFARIYVHALFLFRNSICAWKSPILAMYPLYYEFINFDASNSVFYFDIEH